MVSVTMSALVQNGEYGAINTEDTTTMGYYVVKLLLAPYKLQDDKTVNSQAIKSGELIVKAEYLNIMKFNTNWYGQQLGTKQSVIIATFIIVNPFLYVSNIKDVSDIRISLRNKEEVRNGVQICISDVDNDYILVEIEGQVKIEYERKLHNVE